MLSSISPGPLRSTGVTPLHRYCGPIRLPIRPTSTVMDSRPVVRARPPPVWSLRFPDSSFRTRRPVRPRRARRLHTSAASPLVIGFVISDSLATLNERNEAGLGSLIAAARAFAIPGASWSRLPGDHARIATCQTDHCMVDSFLSTRQTWFPDAPKSHKSRRGLPGTPGRGPRQSRRLRRRDRARRARLG